MDEESRREREKWIDGKERERTTHDADETAQEAICMQEGTTQEGIEEAIEGPSTTASKIGRVTLTRFTKLGDFGEARQKLQQKVSQAWNTVKYNPRWMSVSDYDKNSVVVLLSKLYSFSGREMDRERMLSSFLSDYHSRIWLTYRTFFPPFPSTSLSSDCGWGCTLRSAQMIMAQALTLIHLSRDWRFVEKDEELEECESREECIHREIIELFLDSQHAPLSLHSLLSSPPITPSSRIGKWFSPSEALHLIRRAVDGSSSNLLSDVKVEVVVDGSLDIPSLDIATSNWGKKLVLFVCLRLGLQSINEAYYKHLKHILQGQNCLGMVGGRTNRSLYIIGFSGTELIFLDPHVAQPPPSLPDLSSFHCSLLSKCSISSMDPSCAVGWLFTSKDELIETLRGLNRDGVLDMEEGEGVSRRNEYPLFTVFTHHRPPLSLDDVEDESNGLFH